RHVFAAEPGDAERVDRAGERVFIAEQTEDRDPRIAFGVHFSHDVLLVELTSGDARCVPRRATASGPQKASTTTNATSRTFHMYHDVAVRIRAPILAKLLVALVLPVVLSFTV